MARRQALLMPARHSVFRFPDQSNSSIFQKRTICGWPDVRAFVNPPLLRGCGISSDGIRPSRRREGPEPEAILRPYYVVTMLQDMIPRCNSVEKIVFSRRELFPGELGGKANEPTRRQQRAQLRGRGGGTRRSEGMGNAPVSVEVPFELIHLAPGVWGRGGGEEGWGRGGGGGSRWGNLLAGRRYLWRLLRHPGGGQMRKSAVCMGGKEKNGGRDRRRCKGGMA